MIVAGHHRAGNGFTLVELLMAIVLFALLSAAATGLLRFGVDARARSFERLETLAAVTRTRALLTADLGQAAPRTWRDETGARQPAFTGSGAGIGSIMQVVRRGWNNDGAAPRASLQRVEYRLNGDRLERRSWPMVDGSAPNPPATLMSGVTMLAVRFHAQGQWFDRWAPTSREALPDAVELTVSAPSLPALRQVFLVGPGARQETPA